MTSRRRVRPGLRARIVVALVAISALTLAVAALMLFAPLERALRRDQLRSLAETARAAAAPFASHVREREDPGDPRLRAEAALLQRRTGGDVAVLDSGGRLLAGIGASPADFLPAGRRALRTGRTVTVGPTSGHDDEGVIAVVSGHGSDRVAVVLRPPLADSARAVAVVRRAFVIAAAAGLAAALLLGLLVATRLVARLRTLRLTAMRVAELGAAVELATDDRHDEVGDLTRTFATMQDRLREQDQARRTFIATASHELRTPLTSLGLILELAHDQLREQPAAVGEALAQLERARVQTGRLTRLAADLLALSRIDAGLTLRRELVDLGDVTRAVLGEFTERAGAGGVELSFATGSADPAWAIADPGSVAQVLRVLLDNALRLSAPGQSVTAATEVEGRHAQVSVSDQGPGVAESEAERIFERFARGQQAGRDGGFGLGLAIGRELARRMEGDLVLAGPGPGARFVLLLPPAPELSSRGRR